MIVAINKMDLVDYSEQRFNEIRDAYVELARQLGLSDVRFVPVSALQGRQHRDARASACRGTRASRCSTCSKRCRSKLPTDQALRFPVQWVARQDGSQADDFRGYMGRVEAGEVRVGDTIVVLPANREATVAEIIAPVPGGTARWIARLPARR